MIVHLIDGTYELFRHYYGLRRIPNGQERPFGAVVGAGLLVLIPELLRSYADYRQLLYGVALVLIILARPTGLIRREYGPGWLARKLARS